MQIWIIILTLLVVVAFVVLAYLLRHIRRGASTASTPSDSKAPPLRLNVLLLLAFAYGSIIGLFFLMITNEVDAKDAFDYISVPFVALVGGTLTIAKDIID